MFLLIFPLGSFCWKLFSLHIFLHISMSSKSEDHIFSIFVSFGQQVFSLLTQSLVLSYNSSIHFLSSLCAELILPRNLLNMNFTNKKINNKIMHAFNNPKNIAEIKHIRSILLHFLWILLLGYTCSFSCEIMAFLKISNI